MELQKLIQTIRKIWQVLFFLFILGIGFWLFRSIFITGNFFKSFYSYLPSALFLFLIAATFYFFAFRFKNGNSFVNLNVSLGVLILLTLVAEAGIRLWDHYDPIFRPAYLEDRISRVKDAGVRGGGLFIFTSSANVTIDSCEFSNNSAASSLLASGGGVAVLTSAGDITLTNNTFANNSVNSLSSDPSRWSHALGGGAVVFTDSGDIILTNSKFKNNAATVSSEKGFGTGGGLGVSSVSGNITLTSSTFDNNSATNDLGKAFAGGVDVGTFSGSITLTNNAFTGNSVTHSSDNDSVRNFPCDNSFSTGEVGGGGAFVQLNSSGGGTLTNNTFTLNSTNGNGGGLKVQMRCNTSTVNIYNNIIRGNKAAGFGDDIFVDGDSDDDTIGSTVNLFNNNFSDFFSLCKNTPGCRPTINRADNIDRDPLFAGAVGGDVHVQLGSPAIDKGDPDAPALPHADFEGDPRIVGSAPDIGADEFVPASADSAKFQRSLRTKDK